MNEPTQPVQRKRNLMLILLIVIIAGGGGTAWYYSEGRWYESTENAYLSGNLVEVGAPIGGTVVWIGPEQNQSVQKGQELLRLADGDELALLALRKEELALAVQDVLTLRAEIERLLAEQRLSKVTHGLAAAELKRRQQLYPRNMVSKEELDAAHTREAETRLALDTAGLALKKARVRAGSEPVSEHPLVLVAAARLRTAYRDWRKTRIISPANGEIARRRTQAGQQVVAGTPLFSIAQRHSAWVEANFKETQLRHIRPGQPVAIQSDLYGNEVLFEGQVESIGTGTGSVFSLLPPQNATGNWIKIVQRVPVRITIEKGYDGEHPLPFGAALHIRVDTHDRTGPAIVTGAKHDPVAEADVYAYQNEGVEELIAQIIAGQRS